MAHPSLSALRGEIRLSLWAGGPGGPCPAPVVLMPRRIPGGVAATLDGLPAEALPRFRHEGPVLGLRRALRAAFAERLPRPRWLANWMVGDVLDQAALMIEVTGSAALRVSLDIEPGEAGGTFAAAEGCLRLVTAYRGPGIDWVSPRVSAAPPSGAEPTAAALRRLWRGDVAILRGRGGEGGGVLHRAACGPGAAPLRLTIDEAPGPRRGAAGRADRSGGQLQ